VVDTDRCGGSQDARISEISDQLLDPLSAARRRVTE
jgi:hypothetical protein